MGRIFLTGDKHGNFDGFKEWCEDNNTNKNDVFIILGDAGINYYGGKRDIKLKEYLSSCNITIICIHGNHERRPSTIPTYNYRYLDKFGCFCWYEQDYPNIFFPKDGEMRINGNSFLIVGGAYSVDKHYRLERGWHWFSDEQMNEAQKDEIRSFLKQKNSFDYILSHTAPLIYEPRYLFLSMIDQDTVDKSMEEFLDEVYEQVDFGHWYFGHYHDDKQLAEKVRIVYNDIIML